MSSTQETVNITATGKCTGCGDKCNCGGSGANCPDCCKEKNCCKGGSCECGSSSKSKGPTSSPSCCTCCGPDCVCKDGQCPSCCDNKPCCKK